MANLVSLFCRTGQSLFFLALRLMPTSAQFLSRTVALGGEHSSFFPLSNRMNILSSATCLGSSLLYSLLSFLTAPLRRVSSFIHSSFLFSFLLEQTSCLPQLGCPWRGTFPREKESHVLSFYPITSFFPLRAAITFSRTCWALALIMRQGPHGHLCSVLTLERRREE